MLFPLTIRAIGIRDFGLWLVSGEVLGYLLLSDLGVFAVLPWLVAGRDGAGDRAGIARLIADASVVGIVMAGLLAAAAVSLGALDPLAVGLDPSDWNRVRAALITMLGLSAAGALVRPFPSVIAGLQDAVFAGWVAVAQSVLTIGLTIGLVLVGGYGLIGLAVAAAAPPLLGGGAAAVRTLLSHGSVLRWLRPSPAGGWHLVREGFGPWLAGFGVRLLNGSTSLILAGLGRTDEATLYAATGKVGQLLQNIAWIMPDSGLIGLSQIRASGDPQRTRRAALSLLMMYLMPSAFMAFAVLAVNPAFVAAWAGPDLYAGHAVNAVLALGLISGAAVTGLFKVVGAVGYRPAIGFATLAFGGLASVLSLGLGRAGDLAWVAAGPVVAALLFAIPVGLWLLPKVYPLTTREVLKWWLVWGLCSTPFLLAAGVVGIALAVHTVWCFAAAGALGLGYLVFARPVIARVPWPDKARGLLTRFRLIPVGATESSS